ncbi:MAG: trypsin-like peptidase domain-containing protein [Candidatus Saccharimonadales bacterium]
MNDKSTKSTEIKSSHKSRVSDPKRQRIASFLLLVMTCALAGFGGGYLASKNQAEFSSSPLVSSANQKSVLSESQLISSIAKNVAPSVVSVNVTSKSAPTQDMFGFSSGAAAEQSAGTGIIISEDGYIVTNRHVVPAGTSSVSVTLSDGTQIDDVEVVGRTNEGDSLDVAFLKIKDTKGKKLVKATLGDSAKVQVGDKVVAIGNALGQFQNTVTSGIISGYGRSVQAGDSSGSGSSESLQNLFQTDAAINEGNSGGPLLNISGEVIGINTAVAGGSAQNIGFSIPINDIKGLVKSVLTKGKLERPYLGIRYVSLTDDYAYRFNLNTKRGAYLPPSENGQPSILPGSPAEKAGLKEKDIITKIDGTTIDENNSVTSLIGRKSVGDKVSLTVVRDGKDITIKVTLGDAPQAQN